MPMEFCRIVVKGHLDPAWSEWFGGWAIAPEENGTTTLSGQVADQAALHGVLSRIRDLNLPLVSVRCRASPESPPDTSGPSTRASRRKRKMNRKEAPQ
jgi:hypothetical protein